MPCTIFYSIELNSVCTYNYTSIFSIKYSALSSSFNLVDVFERDELVYSANRIRFYIYLWKEKMHLNNTTTHHSPSGSSRVDFSFIVHARFISTVCCTRILHDHKAQKVNFLPQKGMLLN